MKRELVGTRGKNLRGRDLHGTFAAGIDAYGSRADGKVSNISYIWMCAFIEVLGD